MVGRLGKIGLVVVILAVLFTGSWSPARTADSEAWQHAVNSVAGRQGTTDVTEPVSGVAPRTQPPTVTFVAPSAGMGDYGANHGNVWDMAESTITDIVMVHNMDSLERRPTAEGTIVRGNLKDGPPHVGGIALWGSSTERFPADQYHHMIMRMKIQARSDCWTNGRAAYARTWSSYEEVVIRSMVTTYPYVPHVAPMDCPYGTYCTYYIDLARNNNWPAWPTWRTARSVNDPSTWLTDAVKGVIVVPHEWCANGGNPEYFDLDFVYLTGDIVARAEDNYRYTVLYDLAAPDSDVVTATIRYQELHEMVPTGQQPPCNANNWDQDWRDFNPVARRVTVLKSPDIDPPDRTGLYSVYLPVIRNASAQDNHESYTLDLSDGGQFTDGKSYYLCIEADDGINRTYQGSDTPVVRVPRSPWFGPN